MFLGIFRSSLSRSYHVMETGAVPRTLIWYTMTVPNTVSSYSYTVYPSLGLMFSVKKPIDHHVVQDISHVRVHAAQLPSP